MAKELPQTGLNFKGNSSTPEPATKTESTNWQAKEPPEIQHVEKIDSQRENVSEVNRASQGQSNERQQNEATQTESQQLYETLVQSVDGIVWKADAQTFQFTFVSQQAERILGYPIKQWLTEPNFWINHLHVDDRDTAVKFCVEATERIQDHQFEYRMLAADGRVVWLRDIVTVRLLKDQSVCLCGVMVDITEQKLAEEALQKYTDDISDLYNNPPCGYHSLDKDGLIVQINDTELKWLGLTREEVIGKKRFTDLINAEDARRFEEFFPKFKERGFIRDMEFQLLSSDGNQRSVLLSATAIHDEAGNFLMSRSTLYDITARKLAEANTLKEKQLTEAILESLPGVFFLFDEQGNRLLWNKVKERVSGYSAEELAQMLYFEPIAKKDTPALKQAFESVLSKGYATCEVDVVAKDGRHIPYYFTGQRVNIDGQRLVIGMGFDISERKRAEQELQEIQRRFSDTLTNVDMIAVMADTHGNITFCNDYLLGLTGWNRDEVIGHNWFEMFLPEHEQKKVKAVLGEVQPGGSITSQFENEIKTRSGEHRLVKWTNTTLRDLDNKIVGVAALGDDITERKRTESENRKLLHDLGERIKELTALHEAARILQHDEIGIPMLLEQLAALLPPAFQYPEITVARICLGLMAAETPNFAASQTILRTDFRTTDGQKCSIEVGYLEDCPLEAEGPFLKEERALLNTLGDMLRTSYDRWQVEMAMRESEERFRAIAETIPATVFIYNSRNFAYMNPACETLTGYSREELFTKEIWELVHPEMYEEARERMEARLRGDPVSPRYDLKLVTKSGEVRWAYSTIAGITYQGKPSTLSVVVDITERKQAEEHFKTTSEQLRALTASLSSAREEEGIRIAREIHDELGSALTSLRWDLESLEKEILEAENRLQPQIFLEKLNSMMGLIDTTINTVRRISSELRPSILDDLGLMEAIEWQAQQFQTRTGIRCDFNATQDNLELNQEKSTAVFRIFQEVLTNVLRHAQASAVQITVEENASDFNLIISDDGIGITDIQKSATQSIGLLGMRERAHLVGGDIDITGVEGQGTKVTVRVPILS